MEQLYEIYRTLLSKTNTSFVRYLHSKINWDARLNVIVGSRGVGKTTMILQHILLENEREKSLYIDANNTYFTANSLYDVASNFYKNGGEILYVDEVHKYKDWSREIKMIYDYLSDLKIVVTGSSILDIKKGTDADLSRRAITYTLEGLSFREYLNFTMGLNIREYSLKEILTNKVILPAELAHPLPIFKEYLINGYYPFFRESDYLLRLDNVINQTLEVDIPSFAVMNISTSRKLKKLMYVISRSVPFKPNFSEIGRSLEVDRGSVSNFFVYMEKAGLIRQLRLFDDGMKVLEKVDKIYLSNTNLIYSQADDKPEIGNIRETAFFSLMQVNNIVASSSVSDFQIEDYTFEVGGKSKTARQIKNLKSAYIVKDDIEFGYNNIIPLWAFGFNY